MSVAAWLAPGGPLSAGLAEFELRPQQSAMAEAVSAALEAGRHLVVEAGTGVGKTFAYLLPAVERIVREPGRRVVVSTHTIALQEQLVERDLPLLRSALGVEFAFELVKGRSNYVGLRRLKMASEKQKSLFPHRAQLEVLHRIEDWAYETADGSLSDLSEPPPLDVWEKVRSEHGNCLGRRCPTYEPCFFQRSRRRAERAGLLVVNHALLVSDLALRAAGANVLPDYDAVIVDEAHMLDAVAADHFGRTLTEAQVQYLLSGLFNDRTGKGYLATIGDEAQRQAVIAAQRACTEFFHELHNYQRTRGRSNGRLNRPDVVENPLSPALLAAAESLVPLKLRLPRAEDQHELGAFIERCKESAESLASLLAQRHEDFVYWIEVDDKRSRRTALCGAPLETGPMLRALLFDRVPTVVLTSATLAAADDDGFKFLLGRMGEPPAEVLRLGSPFDFDSQVEIVVEAGMPDPSNSSAFLESSARAIVYHVRRTEGRAFVLFTNYDQLGRAAQLVRQGLEADGYTILVQGESLPRSKMLEVFRTTPRAAIFGTDTFWQGVDVPGEALSNVIITKLPFAVPDRPMVEAKIELMRRRGRNPFVEYQLPEAILKLRQGFGRLIRTRNDRGVVVLLDPRVTRKAYGKQFLASLPGGRLTVSQQPW